MARAIKRFIDVEISKDTPSTTAASFSIPLLISNGSEVTTAQRVREFTSLAGVALLFATTSEEYKAASVFFNQDPFNEFQPEKMLIGRYVDGAIAAVLECGESPTTDLTTWKAIIDGEFNITIDGTSTDVTGLDFSAVTSLDDVASVISVGIAGADVTYVINRFVVTSASTGVASTLTLLATVGTPVGTDLSGNGTTPFLDGNKITDAANPGESLLSQGQIAETAADALVAMENANSSFYVVGLVKALRDVQFTEDLSDEIETRRKILIITSNDANILVVGSTASLSAKLKAKNYKRTFIIYHDNSNLYPDWSVMGQQLPKSVGSTNWSYKTLYGITVSTLTQVQIDAAVSVNTNVYTTTLGAEFLYFGTMIGGKNIDKDGEFIDVVINIDFLQARVEEGLMSLLLEKDIIPFTDGGITIVDTRLKSLLQSYGVNQGILTDNTVVTSFPKRGDVSQADRDNRKLPGGTFNAELTGGINQVSVRGTVTI